MKNTIYLCALLLTVPAEAKVAASMLDPDFGASSKPDFDTRAVVQVRPAFEADGRVCTGVQIEEKILLLSGSCASQISKSLMVPTWRTLSYRAVEKLRPTSESLDPTHDLALVLFQPDHCHELKDREKHVLPVFKSPDAVPTDKKAQVALYGLQGFHPSGLEKLDKEDKDTVNELRTATIDLIESTHVARRTVEISEMPVSREIITRREGTLIRDHDNSAVLIQKDKAGETLIAGVLTSTSEKIEHATVSIRQQGRQPIEFEVKSPELQWTDMSKSALDLPSVQAELKARGLKVGGFEISRSYQLVVSNTYASLTDPQNREFLEKSLTELRRQRDEKTGCGQKTASKQ
jgi:hypothetical protein